MSIRNYALIHFFIFIITIVFSNNSWPYLMLTIGQLVYIPIALKLVINEKNWFSTNYWFFAIPAYIAVFLLQTTTTSYDVLFASIYFLFTIIIAVYGFSRFIKRGFTHIEEFAIDMGLIYLAFGGGWFFAYIAEIDFGFSPLITWLTAIHFHYSAFLLPIFIGLFGRIYKSTYYPVITSILLVSPMIVAIGITFSRWIELFSVLLYIVGIYGLIYQSMRARFKNQLQKSFVRISFFSLGITILFSMLYALGNGFGITNTSIDFMLRFHGILNCLLFAGTGLVGWALATPKPTFHLPTFPVSKIRSKVTLEDSKRYRGIVDNMQLYEPYINCESLPKSIIDFYENTIDYQLQATVKWHTWFKPFAFLYKFVSKKTEQINLPLHRRAVNMTGGIYEIADEMDGREQVRVWLRKIDGEIIFSAFYSQHKTNDRMYMNIALPLPLSSVIGILQLQQVGDKLQLTSKKMNSSFDAGIYLAVGKKHLFSLPLDEDFVVQEVAEGTLAAEHKMRIFGIPFLTITYSICKESKT